MTREVVSLRLSDEERAAIELAAKREGFSISEFLRRAGLIVAHRLKEAKPKAGPVAPRPEPPKGRRPDTSRGRTTASPSTATAVPARRGTYDAEAVCILERLN